MMKALIPYLNKLETLTTESPSEKRKTPYIHPSLKNLGCISLVLIREAIAPVIFRNAEAEITDIEWLNDVYVRAVPNKFKYPEKGRSLQILRALKVGGRLPQNKTVIPDAEKPSYGFDLNTLVFGDSSMWKKNVLPVRAAVNYSDALSLLPKHLCVDETFHNRAFEDGGLFNADEKKNSNNLFTRYFIRPGTLMVQVLSTRGKVLPEIGLKHLLLSIGIAGSYGGQTSITGSNIRTHIVGLYADKFEQACGSPYVLLDELKNINPEDLKDLDKSKQYLNHILENDHELTISGQDVENWQQEIIEQFNQPNSKLANEYKTAQPHIADLFDQWFGK